jgi:FkbH-like protein
MIERELKQTIKDKLKQGDASFFDDIKSLLKEQINYTDKIFLNNIRLKAQKKSLTPVEKMEKTKIAIIGGHTLFPLNDFVRSYLFYNGYDVEIFTGEFDNYIQELIDPQSALHQFKPNQLIICPHLGKLELGLDKVSSFSELSLLAKSKCEELLSYTEQAPEGCSIMILNSISHPTRDFGGIRMQLPEDRNGFRNRFNLCLGEFAPSSYKLIDIQNLASNFGVAAAQSASFYLETKNIYSHDFLPIIAREISQSITSLKTPMKKVLVLDLDNTLWGGVIGDDGIDGIQLGGISPRGEAFVLFQIAIKRLKDRGVILALCSKNEESIATDAIQNHPQMVLRKEDFVALKINWNPKSENIKELAEDLNLGLSSIVFMDDNPAEINIVNQYCPEVETILLDMDPSRFVEELENSRFFEPRSLTAEDKVKSKQYLQENSRKELKKKITNIKDYLDTLEMIGTVETFQEQDIPRISQLINKSNQFNLTTIRRSEDEIREIMKDDSRVGLTVKLKDIFGEHGLISVLILDLVPTQKCLIIETWVMSCRVLKREVEHLIMNEIVKLARKYKLDKVKGCYTPTAKNIIVKDLYKELGFKDFILQVKEFEEINTSIKLT